jgi:hypothetical protein
MLAVRAATRGHHHRVMQKAENSIGVNNRIAELRAPQEPMMWWFIPLLLLIIALDIAVKSTNAP